MRGITPDGKTNRAVPSVMFKMGGSWAHLSRPRAARPLRGAAKSSPPCTTPRTPRTSASSTAPTPTHRWVSSTSPCGVCLATFRWCHPRAHRAAPPQIRWRRSRCARVYRPKVSPGAFLFSYFVPPLPRSAYLFANASGDGKGSGVEELVAQQRVRGRFASGGTRAGFGDDGGRHAPRGADEKEGRARIREGSRRASFASPPRWTRSRATFARFEGRCRGSPLAAGALHVALIERRVHRGDFPTSSRSGPRRARP